MGALDVPKRWRPSFSDYLDNGFVIFHHYHLDAPLEIVSDSFFGIVLRTPLFEGVGIALSRWRGLQLRIRTSLFASRVCCNFGELWSDVRHDLFKEP